MKEVCKNAVCTIFTDSKHPIKILRDAKEPDKKWQFLQIPLMRTNYVNTNGNLYPHAITQDTVISFKEGLIADSAAFMELDHPDWGKTRSGEPKNIAGMLVDVWWDQANTELLIGKAKLFDTDAGKTVRAIIDGGGRLGISQRAFGLTEDSESDDKTIHKVIANYYIVGFDFVGHPATPGMRAGDTILMEGEQNMKTYNEDEVKKLLEDKEKEVLDAAEADIDAKVLTKAQELSKSMFDEKLEDAVKEKLDVAASDKAKELFDAQIEEFKKSMKLEDDAAKALKDELEKKDGAIHELQDKLQKMELDSFIESKLGDYEYRDKVLDIMGDVSSLEDAKEKIDKAKTFIETLVKDAKGAAEHTDEPLEDRQNADAEKQLQRQLAGLE